MALLLAGQEDLVCSGMLYNRRSSGVYLYAAALSALASSSVDIRGADMAAARPARPVAAATEPAAVAAIICLAL